jgi:hypothetical protein
MESDIDWNNNEYLRKLGTYDDMFLSFHYDHCAFDEDECQLPPPEGGGLSATTRATVD